MTTIHTDLSIALNKHGRVDLRPIDQTPGYNPRRYSTPDQPYPNRHQSLCAIKPIPVLEKPRAITIMAGIDGLNLITEETKATSPTTQHGEGSDDGFEGFPDEVEKDSTDDGFLAADDTAIHTGPMKPKRRLIEMPNTDRHREWLDSTMAALRLAQSAITQMNECVTELRQIMGARR